MSSQPNIAIIMLNWNGESDSLNCIRALQKQSLGADIIAVDNGSTDNFSKIIQSKFSGVILLQNSTNLGFAGGVNTGLNYVLDRSYEYVALINNDATPEPSWLNYLINGFSNSSTGIVTGKLLSTEQTIDSTGDMYTKWGLAYPRGRGQIDIGQYDTEEFVFGASGGASAYRIEMLSDIGLFDTDFFAYFEDIDISFRAQLAGWKIKYTPKAVAYHKIGATSSKIKNFTTYHTIKNLPWVFIKNVPAKFVFSFGFRFILAYSTIIFSSLAKGKVLTVFKGLFVSLIFLPNKLYARHKIQKNRRVTDSYVKSIILYSLPPNAHKLRKLSRFLHI